MRSTRWPIDSKATEFGRTPSRGYRRASPAMSAIAMKPAPIPTKSQPQKSSVRIPIPIPAMIPPTKAGPPYS